MKCCMFEKIENPQQKKKLNIINSVGFALFLIMIGILSIIPKGTLPESTWTIGLGVILIGGNVARVQNNIRLCHCSAILGIILITVGVLGIFNITLPIFPLLLVIVGIGIIAQLLHKKNCDKDNCE